MGGLFGLLACGCMSIYIWEKLGVKTQERLRKLFGGLLGSVKKRL